MTLGERLDRHHGAGIGLTVILILPQEVVGQESQGCHHYDDNDDEASQLMVNKVVGGGE